MKPQIIKIFETLPPEHYFQDDLEEILYPAQANAGFFLLTGQHPAALPPIVDYPEPEIEPEPEPERSFSFDLYDCPFRHEVVAQMGWAIGLGMSTSEAANMIQDKFDLSLTEAMIIWAEESNSKAAQEYQRVAKASPSFVKGLLEIV